MGIVAKRQESPVRDHPLMKACRRESVPFTPVWLMRQAGRYMPEYRAVREHNGFLEMCRRPELAAEVTVTAVRRLGVDAAIIFADILLPLIPMGAELSYEKGEGPHIAHPIRSAADVDRMSAGSIADSLGFVGDSIKLARAALAGKPVIGFAGAPFTLASYLIEGGSARDYRRTKSFMYSEPHAWARLMSLLADATADYLGMQIAAGADVVQLFDSWVGALSPSDYRARVMPYTKRAIAPIQGKAPVIHFGTGTAGTLELLRDAGGDVIGLDWRVDLGAAWRRLGESVAVQGNLDPVALFAPLDELRAQVRSILQAAGGRPGHIFNLGHGILPETPVDSVIAMVDMVHEMSAR
jgi:uroporphyrinogen decarboxylase